MDYRAVKGVLVALSLSVTQLFANHVELHYLETPASEVAIEVTKDPAVVDLVALLNENFRLLHAVKIRFGADDGPLFDPQEQHIDIPYTFIDEVVARFEQDNYYKSGVSTQQATTDALMHTIVHEFGHVLVAMYQLPVLGREEDAVDSLATMLLLESFAEGAEIAISAADLFALEGESLEQFEDQDFWSEHSLDEQRFFTTLCHVYASSPERYWDLLTELGVPQERREQCIEEYVQVRESWQILLSPYLIGGVLSY
ncbi:MAG: DUF4344 domain-containing metallopeptidase [Pseudomonadales bacterium]